MDRQEEILVAIARLETKMDAVREDTREIKQEAASKETRISSLEHSRTRGRAFSYTRESDSCCPRVRGRRNRSLTDRGVINGTKALAGALTQLTLAASSGNLDAGNVYVVAEIS